MATLLIAHSNSHVLVDARTDDVMLFAPSPHQGILFGVQSNTHSIVSMSSNNVRIGQPSNLSLNLVLSGNMHANGNVTVGTQSSSISSMLHVIGNAQVDGNLVVNGVVRNIETEVRVTDQLVITNDGTGPAVLINQTGFQSILEVQDDGINVVKVFDGGYVVIGSNVVTPPADTGTRLHVHGNMGVSGVMTSEDVFASRIFVTDHGQVPVGMSNTYATLHVLDGDAFIHGTNNWAGDAKLHLGTPLTYISARRNQGMVFGVNPHTSPSMTIHETSGFVGVGTSNPSDRLHVAGRAKVDSDLEVLGAASVHGTFFARSNMGVLQEPSPSHALSVGGLIRARNGTIGPMIMLIPPLVYSDIKAGDSLHIDQSFEAGNAQGAGIFRAGTLLKVDASTDNMVWERARLVFRAMHLTDVRMNNVTLIIKDHFPTRGSSNITGTFSILNTSLHSGYETCASPWFSFSDNVDDEPRSLLLHFMSSDVPSAQFRVGAVYMQFV